MAEQLQQALVLYRKSHNHRHVLSDQDQRALELSIARLTQDSLKQQTGMASFTHPAAFAEVIRRTVETGKFQGERAASAFSTLENYVLLLLEQPWKREFRTLKLYGGFFCTRVKAHLEIPEQILSIVGYSLDKSESGGNYCLVLSSSPDRELLLTVAFDCLVAATECRHIGERYDKMKCLNFSLFDIMNFLLFEDPSHPISSSSALLSPAAPPPLATPCVNAVPPPQHSTVVVGRGSAFDAGRTASVFSTPQTVTAAGGMGFGVVSTASRTLPPPTSGQVLVAAPRHVHTLPHPHFRPGSSADAGRGLALRADIVTRTVSDLSGPPSRAPSIVSSVMPSRMAGSTAYTSSPYGTNSSGYGTASSVGSASGFVADMATAAIPQTTFPVPRAARHLLPLPPKHSPLSPTFPYADEDPVDSATASYPEGTQEEHMLESLRNMDVGGGGGSSAVEQVVAAKTSVPLVAPELVPVSYDDWAWFHRAQSSGPPPYDTVAGTRHYGDTRLAQHVGVERTRSGLQQPATAVKGVVSQPSAPMTNGQIQQLRTHIGHRSGSADYLPALNNSTLLRNAVSPVAGPLSESALSRTHERSFATCDIRVSPAVGANITAANASAGTFFIPSAANSNSSLGYHTVAYPLSSDPGYFQRQPATTAGVTGPPGTQHKQQVSTFTDMVDATRSTGSHLLSRQASSNGFMLSSNGADTLHTVKHFSPSKGSSAEPCAGIVMREKVGSMTSSRISSLSNPDRPHNSPAPSTLDRQGSHSMDLGALKWRCRRCTMENSAHDTVCVACFKSRDGPDVQYPEAGESKLVCPMCTLENNPGCANCEACNTPLPQDVHTYV